jgi:hypothetical protein
MSLPAYPGRDTAPSYVGAEVPAECPECGTVMYLPVVSYDGKDGRCSACESFVTFDYWREEKA